ncbi:MAG: hypothetical protein H6712_09905 [Myxococcales bacterium]|nr:hypothetical protein [Myxococcales bacterium]MCB9714159.1 hypothetical protein [Myxococcales bacterium]
MARRTAELVVGMGLLLGPLAYALTLEPQTEVVVVQEPAPAAVELEAVPVVPVVETTVEVPPAPVVEPAVEPEPADDRIAFAFVNEAGLVLSTEAPTTWGTGRLHSDAGPGSYCASKRADARKVPEAMWVQRGRTFDLYGAEGKLCTARLGELSVLAQHDGPSLYQLFHPDEEADWDEFEANLPSEAKIRKRVWSLTADDEREHETEAAWLVAEIVGDDSCEGALWARDSSLPAPALLHPSDEPSPLTARRIAEHEASEELAETRTQYLEFLAEIDEPSRQQYGSWEKLVADHPATVTSWLDADGQARFVELQFGYSDAICGDGHYSFIGSFDRVEDGAFEPTDWEIEPVAIFDADLDGELERLYFSDHDNSATLRSETLGDTWTITQVWSCPC